MSGMNSVTRGEWSLSGQCIMNPQGTVLKLAFQRREKQYNLEEHVTSKDARSGVWGMG